MNQSSTFSYESGATTIYVSSEKVRPVCQVCKKPLSGRGVSKFCEDHRQDAYLFGSSIRKYRNDDKLRVEFWTRFSAGEYVPEGEQRKHAVLPNAAPKRTRGRKCPQCAGRMKKALDGLWECRSCGHQLA